MRQAQAKVAWRNSLLARQLWSERYSAQYSTVQLR